MWAIAENVQQMLEDSTFAVDLYISQAHIFVMELLTVDGVSSLSVDRLQLIETYLAAHFATLVRERGALRRDKVGEAEQDYHNIYASGLKATRFGHQAILLDTTGALAKASNRVDNPGILPAVFGVVRTKEPQPPLGPGGVGGTP